MKILQVINTLLVGGAEKLVTDMAYLLNSVGGYECDVMILGKPQNSILERFLQENNVNIIYLNASTIYSLRIIFLFAKFINQYDIIHVHLFPAQYWAVLAKLITRSKIKLITTEHSSNNRRRNNKLFKVIDSFFYHHYDKVISISEDTQSALLNWIILKRRERYKVILNGVNIANINNACPLTKDKLGLSGKNIVGCIARLEEVKNHKMQIDALSLLPDSYYLLLIGDGSLRHILEDYAKKSGVFSRIRFLGIRNDIPSLIHVVDVAILTSYWEGLSLACIESMVCCPFIGTNVNGIRDIVAQAGILVEKGDAKALAYEIKKLMNDNEYYERVKKACRIRAEQFDIYKTLECYINEYKK